MPKFKLTLVEDREYEGRAFIKITATRTGRAWVSLESDDIGNMGELAMVTEEWLNDGNKLDDPEAWEEVA